jgi:hypothetical protein
MSKSQQKPFGIIEVQNLPGSRCDVGHHQIHSFELYQEQQLEPLSGKHDKSYISL